MRKSRNRYELHKLSGSKLHHVWRNMKDRCFNPNAKNYKDYGGRGIVVCVEWMQSFSAFYSWAMNNGYKEGLQIDRINNNNNYSPDNCRFTTQFINLMNRRQFGGDKYSGYRGVSIVERVNYKSPNLMKWRVRLTFNGKNIDLGLHNTKEEAAIIYNNYVIENKTGHPLNVINP